MLDKKERELLISARAMIESCDTQYICIALCTASLRLSGGDGTYEQPYEDLCGKIEAALPDGMTVGLWLFTQTGYYPSDLSPSTRLNWDKVAHHGWQKEMTREQFKNLCCMARLAWIDRILETGEIA